jgi:hypothetical protein
VVGIAAFVGSLVSRLARGAGRVPVIAGALGAAAIVSTFFMLTATDVAIAGYIHRGAADVAVVDGMWVLHNAVFGVLMAAIGVALIGFTSAGAAGGLLPRAWKAAGLAGGALLLFGAATAPAIVDGSPTLFVGVFGFLFWLVFVAWTSIALIRRAEG